MGEQVINHSIHFVGMPKTIRLWNNSVHTFVTMCGEVQKYHGKFCLVSICFYGVLRLFSSSIEQY